MQTFFFEVCWKPPKVQNSNKEFPVIDYTIYFKQIPSFPFLGGGNDEGEKRQRERGGGRRGERMIFDMCRFSSPIE